MRSAPGFSALTGTTLWLTRSITHFASDGNGLGATASAGVTVPEPSPLALGLAAFAAIGLRSRRGLSTARSSPS
jgi:hypothetical protein